MRRTIDRRLQHVLEVLDAGESLLRAPGALESLRLGSQRWRAMRVLADHQRCKHLEIFDPVIAAGGVDAARALALQEACHARARWVRGYAATWSAAAIAADPAGYRAAGLAAVTKLRAELLEEAAQMARLMPTPLAA